MGTQARPHKWARTHILSMPFTINNRAININVSTSHRLVECRVRLLRATWDQIVAGPLFKLLMLLLISKHGLVHTDCSSVTEVWGMPVFLKALINYRKKNDCLCTIIKEVATSIILSRLNTCIHWECVTPEANYQPNPWARVGLQYLKVNLSLSSPYIEYVIWICTDMDVKCNLTGVWWHQACSF